MSDTDTPMVLVDSAGQRWEVVGPGCPHGGHLPCPYGDAAISAFRLSGDRHGPWPECVDGRSLLTPTQTTMVEAVQAFSDAVDHLSDATRRMVYGPGMPTGRGVNIYQCGACGQPTPWGDVCARCQEPIQ